MFDKISSFDVDKEAGRFQVVITVKGGKPIFTGEIISIYKDIGSLERIYSGIIDKVSKRDISGIYICTISGKEYITN